MRLTAGAQLGSYHIQSALGAGGMGEVYLARDTNLGRDVAIKVLPEAFADDAEESGVGNQDSGLGEERANSC